MHMGSAKRFGEGGSARRFDHGPGLAYDAATSALGKQAYSRRKTLPAHGFGTSTRDGCQQVWIAVNSDLVLWDMLQYYAQLLHNAKRAFAASSLCRLL